MNCIRNHMQQGGLAVRCHVWKVCRSDCPFLIKRPFTQTPPLTNTYSINMFHLRLCKAIKILTALCLTWQTHALNSTEMASDNWQWLERKYKSFRKVGIQDIFQKQKPCMYNEIKRLQNRTVVLLATAKHVLTVVKCHAGLYWDFFFKCGFVQKFKYVDCSNT